MAILIVGLCIFVIVIIKRKFKSLNVGSLALVTGGVKCGKSTLSVYIVLREYRRRLRRWKINHFFYTITKLKIFDYEKPLLYSNVPLKAEYVPITKDLLTRTKRFAYGSVIYLQESSLVADSMMFRNESFNEQLLLFNKLIGHETKGGICVMDTQSVKDNHMAVKRCLNSYFYVQKLVRWLPFFLVAFVRECRYSEDGSVVSVDTDDLDNSVKRVLIPKRIWKKFDTYCYSSLTDNLPVVDSIVDNKDGNNMKVTKIVSFKEYKSNEKN